MDNGARVTFNDARRFGAMDLMSKRRCRDASAAGRAGAGALGNAFDEPYLAAALKGRAPRSRRRCWTSTSSRASATSMSARCCFAPASPARLAGELTATAGAGPGPDHPRGAGRGDRGRRVILARLPPGQWRAGLFPARISGSMTARASPAPTPGCTGTIARSCSRAGPPSSVPLPAMTCLLARFAARSPPTTCRKEPAMAYEDADRRDRGLHRPDPAEPPRGAERAELHADARTGRGGDEAEANDKVRCIVLTGSKRPLPPAPTSRRWPTKSFAEVFFENLLRPGGRRSSPRPQADHRGRFRLLPGRRLRAGDDVRLHHRADTAKFGQPEINLGVIRGHGRHAAPDPLRRQVEGDGHVLTGRFMDAAEAERCGLVSRVVPAKALIEEALKDRRQDRREIHGSRRCWPRKR
jgi:hypothetical protein